MEIQYDILNKWTDSFKGRSLVLRPINGDPCRALDNVQFIDFINGKNPALSPEDVEMYKMSKKQIIAKGIHYELGPFTSEVNLNVVNIPGNDQVIRYLNYVKATLNRSLVQLKYDSHYDILGDELEFDIRHPIGTLLYWNFRGISSIAWMLRFLNRALENHGIRDAASPPVELNSKDLFQQGENPQIYLNMLKNTTPPVLDDLGRFIRGPKSKMKYPVVAWFDALKTKGLINADLTGAEDQAAAINSLIPNLSITGRSLGNAAIDYTHHLDYFVDLL